MYNRLDIIPLLKFEVSMKPFPQDGYEKRIRQSLVPFVTKRTANGSKLDISALLTFTI